MDTPYFELLQHHSDCFRINFVYKQASVARRDVFECFLIPCYLLNYFDLSSLLEHTLSSSSSSSYVQIAAHVLHSVLLELDYRARDMLVCGIFEMDVTLYLWPEDVKRDAAAAAAAAALVNSLERVRMDDDDDARASCSTERCAVCLEEFCRGSGSGSELVRTQCSHVFHQPCILRWLQYNDNSQSCPLCRRQML